ncbi:MAG: hypothetical protein IJO24_09690 [Clostridia bacterium]|nr:hypothetical protein [Clostridia bacterium]
MEEIKNASISINLNEGNILISGSEDFVEKNMESIFAFVERNNKYKSTLSQKQNLPISDSQKETPISGKSFEEENNSIVTDKYIKSGVYHVDSEDGSISILKKIPGDNKAEKMKNITLIVLYIRKGKVPGKEIIPICEKHACYDSANFSTTFKNEKTNIIRKGSGQSWTIELTQPGESAALALLEEMANDKK